MGLVNISNTVKNSNVASTALIQRSGRLKQVDLYVDQNQSKLRYAGMILFLLFKPQHFLNMLILTPTLFRRLERCRAAGQL